MKATTNHQIARVCLLDGGWQYVFVRSVGRKFVRFVRLKHKATTEKMFITTFLKVLDDNKDPMRPATLQDLNRWQRVTSAWRD